MSVKEKRRRPKELGYLRIASEESYEQLVQRVCKVHPRLVEQAVRVALQVLENEARERHVTQDLLAGWDHSAQLVHVQLMLWHTLETLQCKPVSVSLPHDPYATKRRRVCFIIPSRRGLTPDANLAQYTQFLAGGVRTRHTLTVLTMDHMVREFSDQDSRRLLCASHDVFFTTHVLKNVLFTHLGGDFMRVKKHPFPIDIRDAGSVEEAVNGVSFWLTNKGTNFACLIGHMGMQPAQLEDNIYALIPQLARQLNHGFREVRCMFIKLANLPCIPFHDTSFSEPFDELSVIYSQIQPDAPKRPGHLIRTAPAPPDRDTEWDTHAHLIARPDEPTYKELCRPRLEALRRRIQQTPVPDVQIKRRVERGVAAEFDPWRGKRTRWEKALKGEDKEEDTKENDDQLQLEPAASGDEEESEDDAELTDADDDDDDEGGEQEDSVERMVRRLRSVSDVAITKTEERRKRRHQPEPEMKLTGYEQSLFTEKPKRKKAKLASPKLTGRERHLLYPEGSYKSKSRDESDVVEIPPELFEEGGGGGGEETVAPLPAKGRKSRAAARKSVQAPATPLRRSARINSVN